MSTSRAAPGHYLIASDFDQTLSFNDSGLVLSELIGVPNFREKVAGLSDIHLVQQGAELTYLLRHDPEFRCVRREHLIETGKRVRLKKDIKRFVTSLEAGADEYHFSFYVISAAPRTVVESALEGIIPRTTSTARSARMTRPPAKSAQSRRSPPATARSRSLRRSRASCRSARTGRSTSVTAAPMST
jgi:hypothetical protein